MIFSPLPTLHSLFSPFLNNLTTSDLFQENSFNKWFTIHPEKEIIEYENCHIRFKTISLACLITTITLQILGPLSSLFLKHKISPSFPLRIRSVGSLLIISSYFWKRAKELQELAKREKSILNEKEILEKNYPTLKKLKDHFKQFGVNIRKLNTKNISFENYKYVLARFEYYRKIAIQKETSTIPYFRECFKGVATLESIIFRKILNKPIIQTMSYQELGHINWNPNTSDRSGYFIIKEKPPISLEELENVALETLDENHNPKEDFRVVTDIITKIEEKLGYNKP